MSSSRHMRRAVVVTPLTRLPRNARSWCEHAHISQSSPTRAAVMPPSCRTPLRSTSAAPNGAARSAPSRQIAALRGPQLAASASRRTRFVHITPTSRPHHAWTRQHAHPSTHRARARVRVKVQGSPTSRLGRTPARDAYRLVATPRPKPGDLRRPPARAPLHLRRELTWRGGCGSPASRRARRRAWWQGHSPGDGRACPCAS